LDTGRSKILTSFVVPLLAAVLGFSGGLLASYLSNEALEKTTRMQLSDAQRVRSDELRRGAYENYIAVVSERRSLYDQLMELLTYRHDDSAALTEHLNSLSSRRDEVERAEARLRLVGHPVVVSSADKLREALGKLDYEARNDRFLVSLDLGRVVTTLIEDQRAFDASFRALVEAARDDLTRPRA